MENSVMEVVQMAKGNLIVGLLKNESCFNADPIEKRKKRVCGCCGEVATREFASGIFVYDVCDDKDHQEEMKELALRNNKASNL